MRFSNVAAIPDQFILVQPSDDCPRSFEIMPIEFYQPNAKSPIKECVGSTKLYGSNFALADLARD